jgi:hypothetical protein
MVNFDKFWNLITSKLKSEAIIKNWTVAKGFFGEEFKAIYEEGNFIKCKVPSAKNEQKPRKKDFKLIFDNWHDYLQGKVKRPELRDKSRNTKYTISIIHHFRDLLENK